MKKIYIISLTTMVLGAVLSVLVSMSIQSGEQKNKNVLAAISPDSPIIEIPKKEIPEKLEWITNADFPEIGSSDAKKGGLLQMFMQNFPQTFRVVGPNSNTQFRSYILGNKMSLVAYHPYTKDVIPELATHWAYGADQKTVYFKLDKDARWSDGRAVTAHDYLYILEFMRSKHINAPWYNNYYSEQITEIKAYDNYTISITGKDRKPQDELINSLAAGPIPAHYYGELNEDWEKDYNWAIAPNTGPYQISEYKKGKYVILQRKKDWWAADKKENKNLYNVDRVIYKVIRSEPIAYVYFKKGELDYFPIVKPKLWHGKAKGPLYDSGLIVKHWFYVTVPEGVGGLFFNLDHPLLKNKDIRQGIAHSTNMDGMIADVLKNDYLRMQRFTEG
ncbi:MAG: ABC transporter substrate-binding protein, partial [Lentisphaeraceae bacterium]|nr:ABC transporter substrate-binding protein [Lentisphaeraceae bacterium]